MILVDTNVLVYAVNLDAPQHKPSRALLEAVQEKRVAGVLVPQILLEFFAIVTDPRRVDNPLEPETAWEQIEAFRTTFLIIDTGLKTLDLLKEIGLKSKGADIFDAFLAAQMKANGISVLCTYNTKDFSKFTGILAQTPEDILSSLPGKKSSREDNSSSRCN